MKAKDYGPTLIIKNMAKIEGTQTSIGHMII